MSDSKTRLLEALNADKNGQWEQAHRIVQSMEEPDAYWIHAYLHRKEGDLSNSGYWYNRAGKDMPEYALDQEWQELYDYITAKT